MSNADFFFILCAIYTARTIPKGLSLVFGVGFCVLALIFFFLGK
jgi:hypothetical protein